jgi:hypothetical protein
MLPDRRMTLPHSSRAGRAGARAFWCTSCVLFASLVPAGARAVEHAVGGELALVAASSRDDILVPHAHSGGGLALGVQTLHELGPGLLDVAARLGMVVAADRIGAMAAVFEHGLGARYTIPVARLGAWRLAVGPALGLDADASYFADWDDARGYWMGSSWLGAAARTWRPVGNGWRLDGAGELGLVGLISRPPERRLAKQDPVDLGYYLVDVYRDPEPAWLGSWQLARVRVEVSPTRATSSITSAWRFGVELRVARADEPRPAFALGVKLVAAKAWGW